MKISYLFSYGGIEIFCWFTQFMSTVIKMFLKEVVRQAVPGKLVDKRLFRIRLFQILIGPKKIKYNKRLGNNHLRPPMSFFISLKERLLIGFVAIRFPIFSLFI